MGSRCSMHHSHCPTADAFKLNVFKTNCNNSKYVSTWQQQYVSNLGIIHNVAAAAVCILSGDNTVLMKISGFGWLSSLKQYYLWIRYILLLLPRCEIIPDFELFQLTDGERSKAAAVSRNCHPCAGCGTHCQVVARQIST
jgi:hypothetical protein